MSLGQRFSDGWAITRQSIHVLMLDKELLVFPILSGTAAILVTASFAVPLWASGYIEAFAEDAQPNAVLYLLLFAFYFANYFVMIFFNSAIVACALKRLRGGDPTVGDGLRAATNLLPQILAWTLLSATVGLVLRLVEERAKGLGRFVTGLIGAAWSVATYFVIPVLVVERVGPFEALQRSAQILRRSWGEALVSRLGLGFVVFGAMLLACIPLFLGILVGQSVAVAVGAATTVVLVLLVTAASTALQAIIVAALYEFASGSVPAGFDEALLRNAFRHRRR